MNTTAKATSATASPPAIRPLTASESESVVRQLLQLLAEKASSSGVFSALPPKKTPSNAASSMLLDNYHHLTETLTQGEINVRQLHNMGLISANARNTALADIQTSREIIRAWAKPQ